MAAKKPNRIQKNGLVATQRLMGPTVAVRAYASGRAQARMTNTAIGIMAGFGFAFLAALVLLNVILLPGILVIILVYVSVRPARGIAITDAGVAVLRIGSWSGRPAAVLGMLPFAVFWSPHVELRKGMRLPVGPDIVTLRPGDAGRLLDTMAAMGIGPGQPFPGAAPQFVQPAPYPPPVPQYLPPGPPPA